MTSTAHGDAARWSVLGATLLGCLALLVFGVVDGHASYDASANAYPGASTAVAHVVGYFVVALLGTVTFGGLTYVVVTARPDDRGVIDARTFPSHLLVERAAAAWAVAAAAMVPIQAASDAGVPVGAMLGDGALLPALQASEMARADVVTAAAAVLIAIAARTSVRWVVQAVSLVPALIGLVANPVTGNAGQGPDHDYATSTVMVFAVAVAAAAGLRIVGALNPPRATDVRRLLVIRIAAGGVAIGYGAALFGLLAGFSDPLATPYGVAGMGVGVALALLLAGDVAALRSAAPRSGRLMNRHVGAVAGIAIVAAISSMATQPAPRFLDHQFTTWDVFLGYELLQPPSVGTVLTTWRFDTFLGTAALVLAGLYVLGYRRLRRRGDGWPVGRLVAWLLGCSVMLFTTSSGVKAYGSAMFSVHMAEHMTLNMFVPVLLVLGGPVTLALRALPAAGHDGPPGPREWLLWLIHSRVTAFVSHPVVAFVLFVASLYAVYFTPVFGVLARYHWGHELMSLHFLLVGYLFFWGIIGIDPGPRRLPFLGRLGLLFAVMPFHAFFGIATMSMTAVIGEQFYRFVGLPWLASIHDDQHLGGAIAWGSSELPVIVVVVALVAQWARQDRRTATRSDRHSDSDYADDDLEAYNAMLRELARDRR